MKSWDDSVMLEPKANSDANKNAELFASLNGMINANERVVLAHDASSMIGPLNQFNLHRTHAEKNASDGHLNDDVYSNINTIVEHNTGAAFRALTDTQLQNLRKAAISLHNAATSFTQKGQPTNQSRNNASIFFTAEQHPNRPTPNNDTKSGLENS